MRGIHRLTDIGKYGYVKEKKQERDRDRERERERERESERERERLTETERVKEGGRESGNKKKERKTGIL